MTAILTIPTATGDMRCEQHVPAQAGPSVGELTAAACRFTETDDRRARYAAIRAELAEIATDRAAEARMNGLTTQVWRTELRREEADCWEALAHLAMGT